MTLNVAHINLAKGLRGGENQTIAIMKGLMQFDLKQALICRKNSELEKLAKKLNLPVIAITKPFLLNVYRLHPFDLIHVHEGRSIYFAFAAYFLLKKPYLVTRRIINMPGNRWLTRLAYNSAEVLVSISKSIDAVMKSFSGNRHFEVIPDIARNLGHDAQELARLKARFCGKFVIGHVGALDDGVKNQSIILKAAKILSEQDNMVFLLLGGGKDEALLKKLVSTLGLKNVIFEGYKTNIADYYALFDIFVYPSKEEGLGSAILEAFNFKLPVIATDIGGIKDILGNNEYGMLINPHDENMLADAIMQLYRDGSLRNHYAETGFRRKSSFSADKVCTQYMQNYQKIINNHA